MNLSFMLELSTKKCTGKKEKLAHCNILFARHNVLVHDFKGLIRKSLLESLYVIVLTGSSIVYDKDTQVSISHMDLSVLEFRYYNTSNLIIEENLYYDNQMKDLAFIY